MSVHNVDNALQRFLMAFNMHGSLDIITLDIIENVIHILIICIQTDIMLRVTEKSKAVNMKICWRWGYPGYPDLQSFQVEPSPCLPFFISVIVFWIMTFFHRQNSVRLRCFFAETDIIQSVSTLLASFFVSSGVELRKTVYFYKIVRYSKYLCTLSLPLAYVLTRT